MTRRICMISPLATVAVVAATMIAAPHASAQNESVLAEVYGRGVHAYYAGDFTQATSLLTSAIDGGTRDPRAYYFRGIISYLQGDTYGAENDWTEGAKVEVASGGGAPVGRSLARFQGSARLKLEQIRQKVRLEAALTAAKRSDARLNELGVDPNAKANAAPAAPVPAPAAPAAPVASDPFADDNAAMAAGQPKVQSDNALEGLDGNPFEDDAPAAGEVGDAAMDAGGDANPFGGPAEPAGDASPFGEADAPDPFGESTAPADDPFADSPF